MNLDKEYSDALVHKSHLFVNQRRASACFLRTAVTWMSHLKIMQLQVVGTKNVLNEIEKLRCWRAVKTMM